MESGRAKGLLGVVLLTELLAKMLSLDPGDYPRWLVILVGTLVAALVIWIMIKLVKVALWLLFFAVLIGGLAWALWLGVN